MKHEELTPQEARTLWALLNHVNTHPELLEMFWVVGVPAQTREELGAIGEKLDTILRSEEGSTLTIHARKGTTEHGAE